MKVSANSNNIEPIPVGMHAANCIAVIDLGTHESEWKGETKNKREVIILWEIPSERINYEKDGKEQNLPRVINKRYTASIGDKSNLGADLRNWRGRAFTAEEQKCFELQNILGAPCLLNICHRESNGNTFANVSSVSPLMKGQAAPEKESEHVHFSFEDYDDPNDPLPSGIPEWIQTIIKESAEYKAMAEMADIKPSDDSIRSEDVPDVPSDPGDAFDVEVGVDCPF